MILFLRSLSLLSFTNWMTSVTCMTSAVIIFQIYNTRGPSRTISQLSIISDLSHRYLKFDEHKTELCIIPYNPVPCPYSLLLLIAQLSSLPIKPKAGYHPPSCIPPLHSFSCHILSIFFSYVHQIGPFCPICNGPLQFSCPLSLTRQGQAPPGQCPTTLACYFWKCKSNHAWTPPKAEVFSFHI